MRPIDAAPAQRSRVHVDGTSLVRLRALMAAGVALSLAAAAAQVMAMPSVIRTTVTLVFAVIGPGAAVIAVLLLYGAAVRDRRVIVFRLSPVVMGALVLPLSVTVLVVTAQSPCFASPRWAELVVGGPGEMATKGRRRGPA